MMRAADWPFLGRDREIADVVAEVIGPTVRHGVLLRGAAGVGKTTLARAVATDLEARGIETIECHGSASLATIAFGALAPLLAKLRVTPSDDAGRHHGPGDATFLAATCDALASSTGTALLVDDVAHADTGSIAVIRAAVLLTGLPVLLTARSTDPLPPLIAGLADEGLLEVIELEGLDRDASDAVLEHALGGPIDPATARQLHETSQGNPLFLRELVRGAAANGQIVAGPHGYVTGPVPSSRLIELLGDRVERADADEHRVLELLAAAQPLPMRSLGPRDVIDRLESDGMVTVDGPATAMLVRLGHPIYDEVIRAATPTARWYDRLRDAAELLRCEAPGDDEALLRAVDLEIRCGAAVATPDLVRAARRAAALLDHEMVLTLADHLIEAGTSSVGQQLRGSARSSLGLAREAEKSLTLALALATTDDEVTRAAQALAQHLAVRVGRADEALDVLDQATGRITDPGWIAFLDADRARWAILAGRATTFARDVEQTGAARLNTLMVEALVNLMDGHLATANRAIDDALALATAHRDLVSHSVELLTLSRCISAVFGGNLPAALELARTEMATAGARNDEPIGMWAYALSLASLHAGRVTDALDWSDLAVPRLAWRDFTGLHPTAVAVRATALAQLGRVGDARRTLAQPELADAGDGWSAIQAGQARAWCAVAEGRPDEGAETAAAAGRDGMDNGQLYLGALTCYAAVRFGRAEPVAEHLEWARSQGEGPLLATFDRHARGLIDQDPGGLVGTSTELASIGMTTAAAEALEQASMIHRRQGDSEGARRLHLRANHLLRDAHLAPIGAMTASALTTREREIAVLAAQRHRSRQIADALGLSVRTVDNHLARVYRKLDVASRDDLPDALDALGLVGGS